MQDSSYKIEILNNRNKSAFQEMLEKRRFFGGDKLYYERCFERQSLHELEVVVSLFDSMAIGYVILNWQPKYAYFKKLELPEIQDLNVIPEYRRRGVGQALIEFCERLAIEKGYDEVGIGVGLDSSYGAAQRIYARLGYIPDGQGISYDRKQVTAGEFRPIDDNLCLMMTKKLK